MSSTPRLDPVIAVAWGLEDRSRRGPKPSLTLEEIVDTAIEIADTDGLSAVSMARVAKSLGFTTMSLYRYVASKDELVRHMVDAATGYPPDADPAPTNWRQGLELWARQMLERQMNRPWVVQVPITQPPLLPRNVAWIERAMGHLNNTPLEPLEKLSTLLLISGYIRNEVSLSSSLSEDARRDEAGIHYAETLGRLIGPDSHPALTRLIGEGLFTLPPDRGSDDDDEFILDFGLQRILDGVESLIADRQSP